MSRPISRSPVLSFGRAGQASTEMVVILPLLLLLAGAMLFVAYGTWQGMKVQQAANLVARVQSQERLGGGTSVSAINDSNGFGGGQPADPDPDTPASSDDSGLGGTSMRPLSAGAERRSLYGKVRGMVHDMFPQSSQEDLFVPAPKIGLNVDKVKVVRVIKLPKIPFFNWGDSQKSINLVGTAYGGEDPYMYGLPRWGQAGSGTSLNSGNGDPEWKKMINEAAARGAD